VDTFLGIAVDAWANVDGECDMAYEVSRAEAQIELGHRTGSLHLVLTEAGLVKLVDTANRVLHEMRGLDPATG
jgi:hypothetical protein